MSQYKFATLAVHAGQHPDLPVSDMSGEDDHSPSGEDRPIHMLEAMRLDTPARFEDPDFR